MNDDLMFTAGIDRDKFKKDVDALAKEILGLEKTTQKTDFTGATRDNIKIQKEAIKTIANDLKELNTIIDNIAPGIKKFELLSEAKKLEQELEAEKKALIELEEEVKKTDASHRSLSLQLQDVKKEMSELRLSGKENTEQYRQLEEKATKYQSAIDSVNKSVSTLSRGGLQPLLSVLSEVSGGFSIGAGVISLFSGENENLERIQRKVNELTAIAVGIQNVHTTAMQSGVSVTGALATSSTRLSAALGISATAARALLLTITGGLILAIPALIYLYDQWTTKQKEAAKNQKMLADAMKEGAGNAAKEATQLQILYKTATDTNLAMAQRVQAVKNLQKEYPHHFGNLSKEIILTGKAGSAYRQLAKDIIAASQARAIQNKMDSENEKFLQTREQFIQRIAAAQLKIKNAKGYSTTMGSGQGTQTIFVSAAEAKKAAEAEFKIIVAEYQKVYGANKLMNDKMVQEIIKKTKNSYKLDLPTPDVPKTTVPRTSSVNLDTDKNPIVEEILPSGSVAEIQKRLSEIDEALRKATESDVISSLKEKRIQTAKELAEAEARINTEAKKEEISEAQKLFDEFVKAHQTFEQQKAEITAKYSKIRGEIELSNVSNEEKIRLQAIAAEQEGKEISEALIKGLKDNPEWVDAFGKIETFTTEKLTRLKTLLVKKLNELKTVNATPESLKAIQEQIAKIDSQIAKSGPAFTIIKNAIKAIGDESLSTEQKIQSVNQALTAYQQTSQNVKDITDGVKDIFVSLGGEMDSAFGDLLSNLEQTISGLDKFAEGAAQALEGFAKGNMLQAAAGAIKAIGGIIKSISGWLNGDKKKERNIKEWAKEVSELKTKYEELHKVVKNALGEDVYRLQIQQIKNLKEQQKQIAEMRRIEASKKKADKAKIADYNSQISQINGQIEDIYSGIANTIAQTDAKGLADKLADAITDAYGKGEDAALAFGKVADDVMKQAVKNALKMQLLEKPMQDITKQLIKNMGFDEKGNGTFDGLTTDERSQIKEMMQAASQNYAAALQTYADIFGEQATAAQGIKGDIKGVTEKTAGALEAQLNAMRINQVENGNTLRNSLLQLVQIESNTRHLIRMSKDLAELNSKTKNNLAGVTY